MNLERVDVDPLHRSWKRLAKCGGQNRVPSARFEDSKRFGIGWQCEPSHHPSDRERREKLAEIAPLTLDCHFRISARKTRRVLGGSFGSVSRGIGLRRAADENVIGH
jgi:hypothetical protein